MTTTNVATTATERPHELNEQWRDAFNAGDLDRLMDMYEPEAVLVPGPDAEPVTGHAAIKDALTWFLRLGGTVSFTPRHWLIHGDLVMSSIAFTMHGATAEDGSPVQLTGISSELARRQHDGTWKYLIDHPLGA